MDAKVTWQDKLSFSGTAGSGFTLPLDADPGVGGEDQGFRPLELMLISLAGCTGMDVLSILKKKKQEVLDFEVKVHADQAGEHPYVFTRIQVEYIISGRNISAAAVERSIELSETKYCPAQAMLAKTSQIEHVYRIIEIV